jgi:hypothetical protein
MALVLADRVKETTTTTGTGAVTLLGASAGFQSFAVIGNANTTYYTIAGQTTTEWEVGIGTYTSSGTTLARTTVLSSSNSGSLVDFTAGTKDVFVTYPSSRSVYADGATLTATNNSVLPIANGGTGTTSTTFANLATNVTGTLPVANGGTGLTAGTSGGVLAYTASGTLASSAALTQYGVVLGGGAGAVPTSTAVGTATHVLTSNGAGVAPTFQALPAGGVTTFTAGTTGFTPNTATSGAVTLAGTLNVASGGTGVTTSTGSGANVLSTSPILVTPILGTPTSGNFSTGTFTWPTFNQNTSGTAAGLSSTLAVASGGTGQTSYTNGQLLIGNTTGNTLTKATLTQGTGITITNGNGTITIASSVSGGVTSVATNNGLTGGTITSTGTLSIDTNNGGGVGAYALLKNNTVNIANNATSAGSNLQWAQGFGSQWSNPGGTASGTWRNVSGATVESGFGSALFIRTA